MFLECTCTCIIIVVTSNFMSTCEQIHYTNFQAFWRWKIEAGGGEIPAPPPTPPTILCIKSWALIRYVHAYPIYSLAHLVHPQRL